MTTLTFRPFAIDDAQSVAQLVESAAVLADIAPSAAWPITPDWIIQVAQERAQATVMLQAGQVVGYANLYGVQEGLSSFAGNVMVLPKQRGKGLGEALIRHMALLAKQHYGAGFLDLSCFSHNQVALNLYQKLGFTPWGWEQRLSADCTEGLLLHLRSSLPLQRITASMASLDHLVLSVTDIQQSIDFYQRCLGMHPIQFGPPESSRYALCFGRQKINLHPAQAPLTPHAASPKPGSADLCLLSYTALDVLYLHLTQCGVTIEEGPVSRRGATGPIRSLYFRDPDGNLIEVSNTV
uniref:GNAT family N-acetyltransferase n=1 Tax=Magnetococcus massalia (strain MO-1) TaxID=451514 RepID=A0A1S7LFH8_MAGMO|nr:Conserved protein of unknown function. Putative glyoxalase domain-containing protein 5 (modular protein) [Candidatus Magnetococcus massalia]